MLYQALLILLRQSIWKHLNSGRVHCDFQFQSNLVWKACWDRVAQVQEARIRTSVLRDFPHSHLYNKPSQVWDRVSLLINLLWKSPHRHSQRRASWCPWCFSVWCSFQSRLTIKGQRRDNPSTKFGSCSPALTLLVPGVTTILFQTELISFWTTVFLSLLSSFFLSYCEV